MAMRHARAAKARPDIEAEPRGAGEGRARRAIITALDEERGGALVDAPGGGEVFARIARIAGYRPSAGDAVIVAGDGADLFIIGVLEAAKGPGIELPDGAVAEVKEGALELRDAGGRLLVRYASGEAEIAAPAGDLTLAAPAGRVVLRAGTDVAVDAARDVVQRAGRRLDLAAGDAASDPQVRLEPGAAEIAADRLGVRAKAARVAAKQVEVLARGVATTAERIATSAERYELTATRLVEKTRDAFRDVVELSQSRVGRARTIVRDLYSLTSRRSVMVSKEETSIDGEKVLLG
jgi:hypothetical protein